MWTLQLNQITPRGVPPNQTHAARFIGLTTWGHVQCLDGRTWSFSFRERFKHFERIGKMPLNHQQQRFRMMLSYRVRNFLRSNNFSNSLNQYQNSDDNFLTRAWCKQNRRSAIIGSVKFYGPLFIYNQQTVKHKYYQSQIINVLPLCSVTPYLIFFDNIFAPKMKIAMTTMSKMEKIGIDFLFPNNSQNEHFWLIFLQKVGTFSLNLSP